MKQNSSTMSFVKSDSWTILSPIEQSIKRKIEAVGTPLREWDISINRGVLTGFNEAFIISGEKKDELIAADPKSAEIIRPILRGRDIKRYGFIDNDLWIINTHNGIKNRNIPPIDINQYPAIKEHLDAHYHRLAKRADKGVTPYNLRNCAYMDDFSKQKVMYNDICQRLSFCLVPENVFCVNTVYFIKNNEHIKYLLAYLDTKIVDWYYRTLSVQLGEKAVRMFSIYVLKIPAPIVDEKMEEAINQLVDIMNSASGNKEQAEQQIEDFFYKIFGFNEEEINFLEGL